MKQIRSLPKTFAVGKKKDFHIGKNVSLHALTEQVLQSSPLYLRKLRQSSNGCSSFQIKTMSKLVKCYECVSSHQARMVERASGILLRQGIPIPRIYAVNGNLVFSEWIEGDVLVDLTGRPLLHQMAIYQSRIHSVELDLRQPSDERFVHLEWLLQRLRLSAAAYLDRNSLERLSQSVMDIIPTTLRVGIIHPDFMKSNIVLNPKGELVIVDNEFLGVGMGFEFDLINTVKSYFSEDRSLQETYLQYYEKNNQCGTFYTYSDFWEICFLAKIVGKRFRDGKIDEALLTMQELQERVACYADKKGN